MENYDPYFLDEYLVDEVFDLIADEDAWSKGACSEYCKICDKKLKDDDHLHIFGSVGDDLWCLDFEYKCAFQDKYYKEYKKTETHGWVMLSF